MIVVLCGVSGVGKSTIGLLLAEKLGWQFKDADDYHPDANKALMKAGRALTDADRAPWLKILADEIQQWRNKNLPTVLACSALKQAYRDALGVDQQSVISVLLSSSRNVVQQRLNNRQHTFMAASLLQSQLDTLEVPTTGLIIDADLSPELICERIIGQLSGLQQPLHVKPDQPPSG